MTGSYALNKSIFVDHSDVHNLLSFGDTIVLARRRVAASDSCYEFIKSFGEPGYAREYANAHYLTRDKYVMLLQVTDSQLLDISL